MITPWAYQFSVCPVIMIMIMIIVRGKTAVKSGMPHATVSLVGWFKNYNTRKITFNPYKCICDTTKTVLRLLVLHIWSYGGSCHELVNGEDYWHSIYGRTVVHATDFHVMFSLVVFATLCHQGFVSLILNWWFSTLNLFIIFPGGFRHSEPPGLCQFNFELVIFHF